VQPHSSVQCRRPGTEEPGSKVLHSTDPAVRPAATDWQRLSHRGRVDAISEIAVPVLVVGLRAPFAGAARLKQEVAAAKTIRGTSRSTLWTWRFLRRGASRRYPGTDVARFGYVPLTAYRRVEFVFVADR
jgi:hypothetical protein